MEKLSLFLIRTMIILEIFLKLFPLSPITKDVVVFLIDDSPFFFLVSCLIFDRLKKCVPLQNEERKWHSFLSLTWLVVFASGSVFLSTVFYYLLSSYRFRLFVRILVRKNIKNFLRTRMLTNNLS